MKLSMPSLLYSAGIAGAVAGIASGLPLIGALNCLLCAWLWLGGMGAVWLYNNREKTSLDAGKGVLVGASAGVVAAIIASIFAAFGSASVSLNDPQFQPYLDQIGIGAAVIGGFALICTSIFFIVFGGLGGLIGASVFKKK